MSLFSGRKSKIFLAVFVINGIFLFVINAKTTQAYHATSSYNKLFNDTLTSQNWNDLFSDFVNTWLPVSMNGPLGIATSAPASGLEVNGDIRGTSIFSSGNVGFGTSTPLARLEVVPTSGYSILAGSFKIGNVALPTADSDAATKGYVDSFVASATTSMGTLWGGTVGGNIWNLNSGNIGIGNTTPAERLDIYQGNINFKQATNAGAPVASLASGGSVDTGTHQYFVRYEFADGSLSSATAVVQIITTAGNNTVNLSSIPVSSDVNCVKRRIYRTKVANPTYYFFLVTTINDNTTTTYTDSASDASLGATIALYTNATTPNTTGGILKVNNAQIAFVNGINTYLGSNAGGTSQSVFSNTAIGTNALKSISGLANANTAVGYNAGFASNTTYATMVGASAGYNAGAGLVAMGYGAMMNATGAYNTGLGYMVGYMPNGVLANASAAVTYQTLLGYRAGQASATQRNYLTAIGADAVGDQNNLLVLGGTGAASAQVVIQGTTASGNLDVQQSTTGFGTVSNSAGGTAVTGAGTYFTNTFKIGDTITIGGETRTISAIVSDTSLTTDAWTAAHAALSAYTLAGGSRFVVKGNGRVGIGTTIPAGLFHVEGAGNVILNAGNVGIGTTSPLARLEVVPTSGYSILAGNFKIGNVALPTVDSDAATKGYVDSFVASYVASSVVSSALYVGITPTAYTGDNNGSAGYVAAQNACKAAYASSSVCTPDNILGSIAAGITLASEDVWIFAGPPGYTAAANDCEGRSVATTAAYGTYWQIAMTGRPQGRGLLMKCNNALRIACCR